MEDDPTRNSATVMEMYGAFGRGDVDTILGHLADDVRWDHGIRATTLPYLQPRTGRADVAGFFASLMEHLEFTTFEPAPPCASGDTVMVAVREAARNVRTGAAIPDDVAVHIWTFDPHGKVASFRHVFDIATHEAAADDRTTAKVGR